MRNWFVMNLGKLNLIFFQFFNGIAWYFNIYFDYRSLIFMSYVFYVLCLIDVINVWLVTIKRVSWPMEQNQVWQK